VSESNHEPNLKRQKVDADECPAMEPVVRYLQKQSCLAVGLKETLRLVEAAIEF